MLGWRHKPVSQPHTVIDRDTEIRGPLRSRGTMEIRGLVIGDIVHRGSLVIAPGAVCTGPVQADELTVRGEVHGDVAVSGTLRIGNGGQLFGDASCRRLIIDAGGRFVGKNLSGSDEEVGAQPTPPRAAEEPRRTVPVQPEPAGSDPLPTNPMPEAEAPQSPAPAQPESVQPAAGKAAEEPLTPIAAGMQVKLAPVPPAPEPQTIVFHGFMRSRRTPVGLAARQNQ